MWVLVEMGRVVVVRRGGWGGGGGGRKVFVGGEMGKREDELVQKGGCKDSNSEGDGSVSGGRYSMGGGEMTGVDEVEQEGGRVVEAVMAVVMEDEGREVSEIREMVVIMGKGKEEVEMIVVKGVKGME